MLIGSLLLEVGRLCNSAAEIGPKASLTLTSQITSHSESTKKIKTINPVPMLFD